MFFVVKSWYAVSEAIDSIPILIGEDKNSGTQIARGNVIHFSWVHIKSVWQIWVEIFDGQSLHRAGDDIFFAGLRRCIDEFGNFRKIGLEGSMLLWRISKKDEIFDGVGNSNEGKDCNHAGDQEYFERM